MAIHTSIETIKDLTIHSGIVKAFNSKSITISPKIQFTVENEITGEGVWQYSNTGRDEDLTNFTAKYTFNAGPGVIKADLGKDLIFTFKGTPLESYNIITEIVTDDYTIIGDGTVTSPLEVNIPKIKLQQSNVVGLTTSLDNKVDKIEGKSLSTNDFNNDYKSKLDSLNISLITQKGNSFNLPNQLVTLDNLGRLPVCDGSQLRNINASALSGVVNFDLIHLDPMAEISYLNIALGVRFQLEPQVETELSLIGYNDELTRRWQSLSEVELLIVNGAEKVKFPDSWIWMNTFQHKVPELSSDGYDLLKIKVIEIESQGIDILIYHELHKQR